MPSYYVIYSFDQGEHQPGADPQQTELRWQPLIWQVSESRALAEAIVRYEDGSFVEEVVAETEQQARDTFHKRFLEEGL